MIDSTLTLPPPPHRLAIETHSMPQMDSLQRGAHGDAELEDDMDVSRDEVCVCVHVFSSQHGSMC